jgi:toxin YoeB
MLRLTWTENALEDLDWWQQHDPKMLKRIIQLCLEICKNPMKGVGKPEPLKFDFQGYWLAGRQERVKSLHGKD